MANAGQFLLEKIAGHETNGLNSMGEFNAKHFSDVVKIMIEFSESVIAEFIEVVNKGESVDVNGKVYSLKKVKQKK